MADKEKVRKGFERCLSGRMPYGCGECPYFGDLAYNDAWSCRLSLMRDAFDLLKEQEPALHNMENVVKEFEEFVKGDCPSDFKHICHIELMENVLTLLKEKEVVVRCKDCKYRHSLTGACMKVDCVCFQSYVAANWFCADGKRKEDDA